MRSFSDTKLSLNQFGEIANAIEKLWDIDETNYKDVFKEITKLVDSKLLNDMSVMDIVDCIASKRPKKLKILLDFCIDFTKIHDISQTKYKCKNSMNLQALLIKRGIVSQKESSSLQDLSEEAILEIYDEETVTYLIFWDKIDMIKEIVETEDFDYDQIIDNVRLIDLAAKFGSVNCFKFLLEQNAIVTHRTLQHAFEGNNSEIIESLQKMFELNNECMINAVSYHSTAYIDKLGKMGLNVTWPTVFQSYNFKFLYDKVFKGDVNMRDCMNRTALMVACDLGLEEIVQLLVESKADLNAKDSENRTAIFDACIHDMSYLPIIKCLVGNGANIDLQDDDGYTALIVSSYTGNRMIAKFLIDSKAKLDLPDKNGKTALHHSIHDSPEISIHLIDAGANVNAKDKKGHTPLYYACKSNHENLVKELVQHKADVNEVDEKGIPIIHSILAEGVTNMVYYLLKSGCSINTTDKEGNTLLMVACRENNEEFINYLIEGKVDINQQNNEKKTALMIACLYNHHDAAQVLIENKANIDLVDRDGKSALIHACEGNSGAECISLLVENKANIEIRSNEGWTPLMYASKENNIGAVRELVHAKAKIESKDNDGMTALLIATRNNALNVVDFLVQSGANVEAKDNEGRTSMNHAIDNGHSNVMMVLQGSN